MSTRDNNGRIILDSWTRDTILPQELDELSRADKVYLMTGGECDDRDWCKCYRLADGRVYAINEGVVLSATDADGTEIDPSGITDDEIHGLGMDQEQLPCYRCPWIDWCERCDDLVRQLGDEAEARAERKAAAAALGRIGGRIGGKSRSEAKVAASRKNIRRVNEVLTAEQRSERARIAAAKRWAGASTCTEIVCSAPLADEDKSSTAAVRTLRERTEKGE